MKNEKILLKFMIEDYSKYSNDELLDAVIKYRDKLKKASRQKNDHLYIKRLLGVFMNLHKIGEEVFKRNPDYKEKVDFDAEMEMILRKNKMNAHKN